MREPEATEPRSGVRAVSCQGCRHYRVTWDPAEPHACLAYGFRSLRLPSLAVLEMSGMRCQLREPVRQRKRASRR